VGSGVSVWGVCVRVWFGKGWLCGGVRLRGRRGVRPGAGSRQENTD
jgi:hypothetical protein